MIKSYKMSSSPDLSFSQLDLCIFHILILIILSPHPSQIHSSSFLDQESIFNPPYCVFLPGPSIQSKIVTNQQMDDIAAKLGAQWKTLATHLEMKAAELREIETDSEDVDMQAKLLLVAWQDREGTQATVDNLVAALNAAGFSQIADSLNET